LEAAIHIRFGLPAKTPARVKSVLKQADRASAFFEASQLAGFEMGEALRLFGRPPKDYGLVIAPLPAAEAQARYLHRFHLLSEAAGYERAPAAFDTE
jgi:hypothetical protein